MECIQRERYKVQAERERETEKGSVFAEVKSRRNMRRRFNLKISPK